MKRTVIFVPQRETAGALLFTEADPETGRPVEQKDPNYVIGSLYIRKAVLGGEKPQRVTVTVDTE